MRQLGPSRPMLKWAALAFTLITALAWVYANAASCGYLGTRICFALGSGNVVLSYSSLPLIHHGFRTNEACPAANHWPSFSWYKRNFWQISIPIWVPLVFAAGVTGLLWWRASPVDYHPICRRTALLRSTATCPQCGGFLTARPRLWHTFVWCVIGVQLIPVGGAVFLMIAQLGPACIVIPVSAAAAWAIAQSLLRRKPAAGYCKKCRYNLTGNVSGVCPECGQPIETPLNSPAGRRRWPEPSSR